ncbi:MAG: hypothetical protein ABI988_20765 [Nitrospirota bacterium]
MFRQGEILLITTKAIPPGALKQKDGILATGEATGHKHELLSDAFVWIDSDGTKYVEVYGKEGQLCHEEHRPVTLPGPAVYRVIRQREYRPKAFIYVED